MTALGLLPQGIAGALHRPKPSLSSPVTWETIKNLKVVVTPLGGDIPPQRRYLKNWWAEVERGMRTLDPGLNFEHLDGEAVLAMGPHIVG